MMIDIPERYMIQENEDEESYMWRICACKHSEGLQWDEVSYIINSNIGTTLCGDSWRKRWKTFCEKSMQQDYQELKSDVEMEDEDDEAFKLQKLRVQISDSITQNNALIRRMSREDTIKQIAHDVTEQLSKQLEFPIIKRTATRLNNSKYKGLLLVSDWHYGLTIDNIFNKYDTTIAKQRIQQLQDETIYRCKEKGITELTVINLGDLIAGNIHLPIRINSRIDVITQIIEVSEIYAEFLYNLSQHFHIKAYSVLDNHSRIDPNKETSLQLESLARITDWFLKERLKDCDVEILENYVDSNIATFEIDNYKIIGVHGDLDKQSKLVESLTTFTQQHYDLIVSAHLHHFSADEKNGTAVVCNGSLMATDDYAFKLRLNSFPSQTLIIVSDKSVCDEIHRIILN